MGDFTDRSQFLIGDLLVVPERNVVMRDGKKIDLQLLIMAVLILLAEEAGKVISPGRFLITIWRTVLHDKKLVQKAISDLRKWVGNLPCKPRHIETVPRTSYRLIASVSPPKMRPLL